MSSLRSGYRCLRRFTGVPIVQETCHASMAAGGLPLKNCRTPGKGIGFHSTFWVDAENPAVSWKQCVTAQPTRIDETEGLP